MVRRPPRKMSLSASLHLLATRLTPSATHSWPSSSGLRLNCLKVRAAVSVCVSSCADNWLALVNIVNFYLDPSKPTDLQTLAAKTDISPHEESTMRGLIMEALREPLFCSRYLASFADHVIGTSGLDPPFRGVYREYLSLPFAASDRTEILLLLVMQVKQRPRRLSARRPSGLAKLSSSTSKMPVSM